MAALCTRSPSMKRILVDEDMNICDEETNFSSSKRDHKKIRRDSNSSNFPKPKDENFDPIPLESHEINNSYSSTTSLNGSGSGSRLFLGKRVRSDESSAASNNMQTIYEDQLTQQRLYISY